MADQGFGDSANRQSLFTRLTRGEWSTWHIAGRCTACGRGFELSRGGSGKGPAGLDRWLCPFCGADISQAVTWIGRVADRGLGCEVWEWLPAERLPPDIQPKNTLGRFERAVAEAVERELPRRLDAEFDARVKAAVEVEVAERLGPRAASPRLGEK